MIHRRHIKGKYSSRSRHLAESCYPTTRCPGAHQEFLRSHFLWNPERQNQSVIRSSQLLGFYKASIISQFSLFPNPYLKAAGIVGRNQLIEWERRCPAQSHPLAGISWLPLKNFRQLADWAACSCSWQTGMLAAAAGNGDVKGPKSGFELVWTRWSRAFKARMPNDDAAPAPLFPSQSLQLHW